MKLFLLLISLLVVHCVIPSGLHRVNDPAPVEKKEIISYQLMPANLFMQFN